MMKRRKGPNIKSLANESATVAMKIERPVVTTTTIGKQKNIAM